MSGRISLYVLNPFAVKSYRKATMQLNKNDAADARLIASYLLSMITTGQITPWQAPSLAERLLRELTRRRAELVTLREAEYNRLEKFRAGGSHPHPVIESVQELIAHLEQQIREIDEAIEKHIDDAGLRDTAELLRSIDGIGKVSSASFIGEAGDISRYSKTAGLTSWDSTLRKPVGYIDTQKACNEPHGKRSAETRPVHGGACSYAKKQGDKRFLQQTAGAREM